MESFGNLFSLLTQNLNFLSCDSFLKGCTIYRFGKVLTLAIVKRQMRLWLLQFCSPSDYMGLGWRLYWRTSQYPTYFGALSTICLNQNACFWQIMVDSPTNGRVSKYLVLAEFLFYQHFLCEKIAKKKKEGF